MSRDSLTLKIQGLDCVEEVTILKREIGPLVGGEAHLSFDILKGQMTVLPTAVDHGLEAILQAVRKTGMRAVPLQQQATEIPSWWAQHGRLTLTIMSGTLTLAGLLLHRATAGSWAAALNSEGRGLTLSVRVIYALAVMAGVYLVLPKAWFSLRRGRPDMNLLMTVAVCGAVGIGEWFEAATVSFLFALSLTLESWSVRRARRGRRAARKSGGGCSRASSVSWRISTRR